MKENYVIDLINKDNGNFNYDLIEFPDGQVLATLIPTEVQTWISDEQPTGEFLIKSRGTWRDIQKIIAIKKAIDNNYIHVSCALMITYLVGERSDRCFEEYQCNYLRDVIAPVINSLNFETVFVFDPHSDVTEGVLKHCIPISNEDFIDWVLDQITGTKCLVIPDIGAVKRVKNIQKLFDGVILCDKTRDHHTGEITGIELLKKPVGTFDNYLVVDDIADGCGTFSLLASVLRDETKNPNLSLVVSKGIFSKGFEEVLKNYKTVYTTNAFKNINHEKIKVYEL